MIIRGINGKVPLLPRSETPPPSLQFTQEALEYSTVLSFLLSRSLVTVFLFNCCNGMRYYCAHAYEDAEWNGQFFYYLTGNAETKLVLNTTLN